MNKIYNLSDYYKYLVTCMLGAESYIGFIYVYYNISELRTNNIKYKLISREH